MMQLNMATTKAGGGTTRDDGDFAWRVLDQMPAALLVVGELGHDLNNDDGVSVFDYVHPDDATWLAETYLDLVNEDEAEADALARPSVHIRIVTSRGETIPREVNGARSVTDEVIRGVIYDVRPARYHDVLGHVLTGLTAGDAVADLLGLVAQLIALPPLNLEAAVLEHKDGDVWNVVSSTSDELSGALGRGPQLPFRLSASEPVRLRTTTWTPWCSQSFDRWASSTSGACPWDPTGTRSSPVAVAANVDRPA
jgi:hypothetical protein